MDETPPEINDDQEKNNQQRRKRVKFMLVFIALILMGSLACAIASLPRQEEPTPSARRIPARYTQPESFVPEDRELLSDVRTSFIPTGAIALPPKNDLQDVDERNSEVFISLGSRNSMRYSRNPQEFDDNKEFLENKLSKGSLDNTFSRNSHERIGDDGPKNYNDDVRAIRRHESFVSVQDDEKGIRNRRDTPINFTASSLVWQISPKSNINFTLDAEPITWQEKTIDLNKSVKGPIDDVVDTFKSRSEQDSVIAVEINQEAQSFIGAQSFWTSSGDPESIRKTQADLMMQHMDQTVDPCDDFYQYACGNWEYLNPIPADKAGFDTFEMLRENLDIVLKDLLSSKPDCDEKELNNPTDDNLDNENNVLRTRSDKTKFTNNCPETIQTKNVELSRATNSQNSRVDKITEDEMIPDHSRKRIKRDKMSRTSKFNKDIKTKLKEESEDKKEFKKKKFITSKVKRQAIDDDDDVASPDNTDDKTLLLGATTKARYLYESCMNYEILEKRGHKPLLELLDSLGGWPLLKSDWNETNFDWLELMARLRLYNNDILLSEWVGPDIKNSDEFVIQFDQTSLGLPTRDYFLQPVNDVYLEAYKNYLIKITTLLGSTYGNALKNADDLINFESRLAKITSGPEERRNVSELYQRLTIEELKQLVPQIDWQRYLSIVLNRTAKLNETVVIFALKYVQDLVVLLRQTKPKTISNYLLWRFVRHRVNNLDDRFQEAKQRFYFTLFGREQAPPRWKNCVTQVNSNMGMALGSMFVRRYFDENSKNDTLIMTREIQESFRELLNLTSWIDEDTKLLAGEKVDAMMLRIGYPDFILNQDELNERYRDVSIHPDMYFENTLNILKHLTKIEQARLGQPVNKTVWNTAPAVVNAYYSRNKNQIMFPAGILQPPFYHRYFPKSLNYGGIGVVIGHEITHGFDDKGRLFDKFGNLHRWWHDTAIEMFHNRAQCLIDQYGHYTVSEVSMAIDGLNTQGENIADNGGIKQAFRAYQRWLQDNDSKDELLPGLNATYTQLFFLNFAQVWCGAMRPEAMKNKLKTAVHSPGKFRVIGTLSNSEDFAKEYKCPIGSPMNPIKKCNVW